MRDPLWTVTDFAKLYKPGEKYGDWESLATQIAIAGSPWFVWGSRLHVTDTLQNAEMLVKEGLVAEICKGLRKVAESPPSPDSVSPFQSQITQMNQKTLTLRRTTFPI